MEATQHCTFAKKGTMPKFKSQLFLWLFLHFQYIDPDFESDQWLFCTQKDIGSVCDIHQKSQL